MVIVIQKLGKEVFDLSYWFNIVSEKKDYASWYKPTGEICPECGDLLVEKKKEIVCNKCEYKK